jgi:hypothetical protein
MAVMGLNQTPHDGQPQAGPTLLLLFTINLAKAVKDPPQGIGPNANAVIADRQIHIRVLLSGRQSDMTSLFPGELDSVVQQVIYHLGDVPLADSQRRQTGEDAMV